MNGVVGNHARLADSDTGGVQVDVDRTQPEQLAAAHSGGGGQQPGGVLAITLDMDPVFVALNPSALPARERSPAELHEWVHREEQYATLVTNVVVELYSESHARQPTTRAWAIIRRADRANRLTSQRASRADRRHTDRTGRAARTSRPHQAQEREMVADAH